VAHDSEVPRSSIGIVPGALDLALPLSAVGADAADGAYQTRYN